MIAINKAEKDAIRNRFPKVHIVRTMKQKSKRHRYYCEENKQVMQFLKGFRSNNGSVEKTREGGYHTVRKKDKRVHA